MMTQDERDAQQGEILSALQYIATLLEQEREARSYASAYPQHVIVDNTVTTKTW